MDRDRHRERIEYVERRLQPISSLLAGQVLNSDLVTGMQILRGGGGRLSSHRFIGCDLERGFEVHDVRGNADKLSQRCDLATIYDREVNGVRSAGHPPNDLTSRFGANEQLRGRLRVGLGQPKSLAWHKLRLQDGPDCTWCAQIDLLLAHHAVDAADDVVVGARDVLRRDEPHKLGLAPAFVLDEVFRLDTLGSLARILLLLDCETAERD